MSIVSTMDFDWKRLQGYIVPGLVILFIILFAYYVLL